MYSNRELSRLVSASLLYGSCHASLQYAVGACAAGKMTRPCRMSSSVPWCENIASALPRAVLVNNHRRRETAICKERTKAVGRRRPARAVVGMSAPSEKRGRGVPTEACKGGDGGGIRSQPQLHSHPNGPLHVSYTLGQQPAWVRKMLIFHLPLVALLLCSSDASRRELSIAPIGLQFRLPQPRGLQF